MKIVITGKTGTGKRELANAMAAIGNLKVLKTSTTRKPRKSEDPANHGFLTAEQAGKVNAKYLYTKFGEDEYFCSEEDLRACDVAVLDPVGLQDLTVLMPDEIIQVVYMHVDPGDDNAVTKLENELENRVKAEENADAARSRLRNKRCAESERFAMLEELLFDTEHPDGNKNLPEQKKIFLDSRYHGRIVAVADFKNSFNPKTLNEFALTQVLLMRRFKNLRRIVEQCVQLEVLSSPAPGMLVTRAGDGHDVLRPIDDGTYAFLQNPAALAQLVNAWLTHDLSIGAPGELLPKQIGSIGPS